MAKTKDPEQRSSTSAPQPGQGPTKPTGDEVYRPPSDQPTVSAATSLATETAPEADSGPTSEELRELEDLRKAVERGYSALQDVTSELTETARGLYDAGRSFVRDKPAGTVAAAVALGVFIGVMMSQR